MEELRAALGKMASNKSPGIDGLTVNLYKACPFLLEPLLEVWQASVRAGQLPFFTRTGVVCLLHKKGDPAQLTNWRPITFPRTDACQTSSKGSRRKGQAL